MKIPYDPSPPSKAEQVNPAGAMESVTAEVPARVVPYTKAWGGSVTEDGNFALCGAVISMSHEITGTASLVVLPAGIWPGVGPIAEANPLDGDTAVLPAEVQAASIPAANDRLDATIPTRASDD